jgi:hypothetical protein
VKDAVVTIPKDHFLKPGKREPTRVIHTGNPFVGKGKVSGPPTEKPVQIGERRVPPRPVKESKNLRKNDPGGRSPEGTEGRPLESR